MTNPHPQHTAPSGYTLTLAPHEHVFIEAEHDICLHCTLLPDCQPDSTACPAFGAEQAARQLLRTEYGHLWARRPEVKAHRNAYYRAKRAQKRRTH